jgi:hypothetical protein
MVSIQINVRRKPNKGNQEWTIQMHRQHCAQDTERRQTIEGQTIKWHNRNRTNNIPQKYYTENYRLNNTNPSFNRMTAG